MLTKEERAEIAKRFGEYNDSGFYDIYTAVTGEKVPSRTTRNEDFTAISNVILNLCDTSNMLELPLDKDGEVIRIGDVVYDNNGKKYNVDGYVIHSTCKNIIRVFNSNSGLTNRFASGLTHKKPVTIKSLAQRIRDVLRNDHSEMSSYASHELVHIANDLERLGDSDD